MLSHAYDCRCQWESKRVFYATTQTFFIDMAKGRVDATDIVLVIVGEFAGVVMDGLP